MLPLVTVPAGVYKGQESFVTWTVLAGVGAPASLPEDVAYRITKVAIDQKDQVGESFKPAKESDIFKMTVESATTPMHPGAIKYFREKGQQVPDRLVPKS